MALTKPIKSNCTLKKAVKWLDNNKNEAFPLLYTLLANTGLRVTDATEIMWSDINFSDGSLTVQENKGTRGNLARARNKVLEKWHRNLYHLVNDSDFREQLFSRKPKDILGRKEKTITKNGRTMTLKKLDSIVPARYLEQIKEEIEEAQFNAPVKTRVVDIPNSLLIRLKERRNKYQAIDEGYVFHKMTLRSSNRARGWLSNSSDKKPVITRQSVFKAFKAMQSAIDEKIEACAHGLRKTFARFMYLSNGRDLNAVMIRMGWSDVSMCLRYLGFDEDDRKQTSNNTHEAIGEIY